ncbi:MULTISPECIES: hypothetical protein [unclassified Pseudoalteromonas]|uniref:hypothetical protein n=1 Tax=unclassified Pseudoalteromonas TaxID=194690 RepID=UPI00301501F1
MRNLFALSLFLLSGCSSAPTLHIFEAGLKQKNKEQLLEQLEQHEINYRFTRLPVPKKYQGARLNISPMATTEPWILKVENIVRSIGFNSVVISEFNTEGHRYTSNNAGLYLVQSRELQELPNLLFAHQCQDDSIQLRLFPDGKWQQIGTSYHGHWRYEKNHLTLKWLPEEASYPMQQVYRVRDHTIQTLQGPKPAKTFSRMTKGSWPIPLFNCDLQVILAD